MVLAVCGGSPGEKDELDPGNGSTGAAAASFGSKTTADTKPPEDGSGGGRATVEAAGGSAQENTFAAAEAALQVRCGFLSYLPGGGCCGLFCCACAVVFACTGTDSRAILVGLMYM